MPPELINPFDRISRFLIKLDTGELIAWLLGLPILDWATRLFFIGWADTSRIASLGSIQRVNDLLALILDQKEHGRPCAVIIEVQIDPDPKMLGRLFIYVGMAALEKNLLPDEYVGNDSIGERCEFSLVVINLRGHGNCGRTMEFTDCSGQLAAHPCEWNLASLRAEEILAGIRAGTVPKLVLAWIPLMQGGGESAILEQWRDMVEAIEDRQLRGDLVACVRVYATAVNLEARWIEITKGINVIKSSVVEEWKEEGRVEGEIRGEIRGELKRARASLLQVLRGRFGALPEGMAATIESIADLDRLSELLDFAISDRTLETFAARLN